MLSIIGNGITRAFVTRVAVLLLVGAGALAALGCGDSSSARGGRAPTADEQKKIDADMQKTLPKGKK